MTSPKTLILYHGGCPDGFGGAYAAWKKFGDQAEYIPLHRGVPAPDAIDGNDVYLIDFTYTRDVMDDILARAASVIVLDHHEGVQDVVEAMPEYVYDSARSGATIAWGYFHPGVPVPKLLSYVEDDDIYRFTFPETKPLLTYLIIQPLDFVVWDEIARKLEDPTEGAIILEKAAAYREYFEHLAEQAVEKANLVSFEGEEIYFANSHPHKTMKSLIGNLLAKKKGPFALVVSAHPNGYGVSIRGDGTVNVAKIAEKYGGNGHPNSAGFLIPREGPFPWEIVETNEDTGNTKATNP
ncbi:MAG TPA: hypothetical protein VGB97_02300 [Candidatus Paceibacterota bacterium]|jgi:oligoribonuclease NrnB/cAMP/cGMP phosphodiesterase (DHH superfamily)